MNDPLTNCAAKIVIGSSNGLFGELHSNFPLCMGSLRKSFSITPIRPFL